MWFGTWTLIDDYMVSGLEHGLKEEGLGLATLGFDCISDPVKLYA